MSVSRSGRHFAPALPFAFFAALMVVEFFVVLMFFPETKESLWKTWRRTWAWRDQN